MRGTQVIGARRGTQVVVTQVAGWQAMVVKPEGGCTGGGCGDQEGRRTALTLATNLDIGAVVVSGLIRDLSNNSQSLWL